MDRLLCVLFCYIVQDNKWRANIDDSAHIALFVLSIPNLYLYYSHHDQTDCQLLHGHPVDSPERCPFRLLLID